MQNGYRDLLKLADNFAAFNQRLKYAHYRPLTSLKTDPRSWWKYAYRAVSDQMKAARYPSNYLLYRTFCRVLKVSCYFIKTCISLTCY